MTTISSSARQVAWPVAVWIVAMLTLGVGAAGVIAAGHVPVGLDLLWQPLLAISASAVGTFILVKRPGHGIGRICLGAGLVTSFSMLARGLPDIGGGAFASISSGGAFGVLAAQLTILIAMVLIGPILIGAFPTGRFSVVSRRVIAAMLALALPVMVIFVGGSPTVSSDGFFVANPLWISLLPVDAGTTGNLLGLGLYAVGLALAAVALALRYRRSGTIERLQIRWVAANAFVIVAALVSMALDPFGVSDIAWSLWLLAAVFVPISVGIAILRYHLYDIDRIISSTVAYAVITALLFGVFAAINVGLQSALRGNGDPDPIFVAVATLVVAALFNPVRTRVQRSVDRRFHRARYDARAMVEDFSSRLRNELDLGTLAHELTRTTELAVEPSTIEVWLRARTVAP
jgi:hypothetical protein